MSSPKVDRAISLVKELILSGKIRPGDQLPNETELSAQLGVSRNSLREAVRAMQTMRILEARQGDGTYVSDLDPADMMDVLSFAVDVSDAKSVVWYLELRRVIEMATVQAAAVHRTAAQLDALTAIHSQVNDIESGAELMRLDGQFHMKIAEIGGNPVMAALLGVVSAPTLRARIWRQKLADQDFSQLRREHELILVAIREQNVNEAGYAMWHHLSMVISWVKQNPMAIAP